jgi:hypothetical protein
MRKDFLVILLLFAVTTFFSCKKIGYFEGTEAKLNFSGDKVLFDTVFTKLGSATQVLQVYNPYNQKLKLSSIRLAKGNLSSFRLNIDGIASDHVTDLEIGPKDSLWIFVQVTVNPLNSNSPLIVNDSILFELNGNVQDVDLIAWGQDAVYFYPDTRIPGLPPFSVIPTDANNEAHWTKDKPIVIFDFAVVDSAKKLIVDAGTKIHFYTKNSGLWVYKDASIKVNGTKEEPVIFQGGRLEADYREEAGQWDRIWINESQNESEFNYAIIKNGFLGIQAEILETKISGKKLILNNVWIRNMSGWGLLGRFYDIDATNTIVSNCGKNALALTLGGKYNFTHCTFANYWSASNRKSPMVFMSNYSGANVYPLEAKFYNTIVYGDKDNEFETDFKGGANDSIYRFENCLLKITNVKFDLANISEFVSSQFSIDPKFRNARGGDYHIAEGSAAIEKGNGIYVSGKGLLDYDGKMRPLTNPDIGAYQH